MPWRESCVMDERLRFVVEHLSGEWTMVDLCDRYGISRQSGYKWVGRYREEGASGLVDRSRAAKAHGRATGEAICDLIVALREARPSWGPRKLVAKLKLQHPDLAWPAASTAGEVLKRAGLVTGRRRRWRAPQRFDALTQPERANHVWGVDHKGWIRLADRTRCEPLTVTDIFSRYLLRLSATASTREEEARPLFERAFEEHGLPETIRSDSGPPFASPGLTGLTALGVWWTKLGIRHERIDAGKPQQNGRHERFHLTLLEAMRPAAANRAEQEARFAAFLHDYNEERPHQALKDLPPARLYKPSPRKLPKQLPEPDYPAEAALRKVRSNGEIKWSGRLVPISCALIGEPVAVEETASGDWLVSFYAREIAIIDRKTCRPRRPDTNPRDSAQPTAPQP